ncbi:hypothetical protein, partial [Amycolatopsis solani]|uniref:hypothetical protein n=1 Tax=Amycolatopsis solani TaxID=3028615 RepID=UPI0025B12AA9
MGRIAVDPATVPARLGRACRIAVGAPSVRAVPGSAVARVASALVGRACRIAVVTATAPAPPGR